MPEVDEQSSLLGRSLPWKMVSLSMAVLLRKATEFFVVAPLIETQEKVVLTTEGH